MKYLQKTPTMNQSNKIFKIHVLQKLPIMCNVTEFRRSLKNPPPQLKNSKAETGGKLSSHILNFEFLPNIRIFRVNLVLGTKIFGFGLIET